MKTRAAGILIVVLIATFAAAYGWAQGAKKAAPQTAEPKIVVFNPRGIQPDIRKIPMATRPATLDGKTVYIVDTKYREYKAVRQRADGCAESKIPQHELGAAGKGLGCTWTMIQNCGPKSKRRLREPLY